MSHFVFFFFFSWCVAFSPHLLQSCRENPSTLFCCDPQKYLVDYKTLPIIPLTWGWADNAYLFIFRWAVSFKRDCFLSNQMFDMMHVSMFITMHTLFCDSVSPVSSQRNHHGPLKVLLLVQEMRGADAIRRYRPHLLQLHLLTQLLSNSIFIVFSTLSWAAVGSQCCQTANISRSPPRATAATSLTLHPVFRVSICCSCSLEDKLTPGRRAWHREMCPRGEHLNMREEEKRLQLMVARKEKGDNES